jgi:hypothetical protein
MVKHRYAFGVALALAALSAVAFAWAGAVRANASQPADQQRTPIPTVTREPARTTPTHEPDAQAIMQTLLNEPREIYLALRLGDDVFEAAIWRAEAREEAQMTTATWLSERLNAVASVQILTFDAAPAGVEAVRAFFDDAWFEVSFSPYNEVTFRASCELGDIVLWEYDVTLGTREYAMRYWVFPVDAVRAGTFLLTIPRDNPVALERYSERAWPLLSRCPQ